MKLTVGFIGTGLMGSPMAVNLARAGFDVRVWNRTAAKTQAAVDAGARRADTLAQAVAGRDAVVLMLPDGPTVTAVLGACGLLRAGVPGTLVIDMSSVSPIVARDHAELVRAAGGRYLDAPVSGGTIGAAAGTLTIMAGGDPDDFAAAEPIFRVLGTPHRLGPPGRGQLCKLANLTLVAVTIGAVAEALTLVKAGGGDPAAARQVLLSGFSQSRVLEVQGERMVRRDFVPGGHLKNQLKDLDTVLSVAARHGVRMPLTARVRELFAALREARGEDLDHSALILEIERLVEPVPTL